ELHLVQVEQLRVLRAVERRIREQQLRRTTLHDGAQEVGRREIVDGLRGQEHRRVALSPGLERFLDVRPQAIVLDEAPGFIHDAERDLASGRGFRELIADAVQDVEQQRFQDSRVRARILEVEHLESLQRQRVVDVIEEVGVSTALYPLA